MNTTSPSNIEKASLQTTFAPWGAGERYSVNPPSQNQKRHIPVFTKPSLRRTTTYNCPREPT